MKRQPPQLRRHGEGDLDEVVEVGLARDVAQAADIVGLQRAQRAEAVQHHAGLRAKHVPMHVEQPASRRVQEQIDAFGLCDGAVASEGQGIDAIEGQVVAVADQRLELRDDARAPGPSLLDLGHLAFEKPLLDVGHDHPANRIDAAARREVHSSRAAVPRQVRRQGRLCYFWIRNIWPSPSVFDWQARRFQTSKVVGRISRRRNPPFAPRSIGGLRASHAQFTHDHVIGEEQAHKPIHDRWFTIANLDVRFHGESPSCELEGHWRRVAWSLQ